MISSVQSYASVQPSLPTHAEVDLSNVEQVADSEDLAKTEEVVEFKEAGALAKIVVAVRTKFNESQRLVDILA